MKLFSFGQKKITPQEYYKRIESFLSPLFHEKKITAVGVGAGSYMIEKLARFGPREIRLCDFDSVEVPNLVRTAYTTNDLGRPKVRALAKRIRAINPFVHVECFPVGIFQNTSMDELHAIMGNANLIIAGTDQFIAHAKINEISLAERIPAVYIGIHAQAKGGRVLWTIPGKTPCYFCMAKERYQAPAEETNIAAAQGMLVDCQFIDMIALKISLAILEREQNAPLGKFFEKMKYRNEVAVRCDPEYEWGQKLWDAVVGDLPKTPKDYAQELKEVFFSLDSLWLPTSFDPACPYRCRDLSKGEKYVAPVSEQ